MYLLDVDIVQRGVHLVQHEKGRLAVAENTTIEYLTQSQFIIQNIGHLWMLKRRASAAMVFSPPESCSMSLQMRDEALINNDGAVKTPPLT